MTPRPQLLAHARRHVQVRREAGAGVLEALAAVRAMYADVITCLLKAEKNVPADVLAVSTIIDDWQATLTPGNPYTLKTACLPL